MKVPVIKVPEQSLLKVVRDEKTLVVNFPTQQEKEEKEKLVLQFKKDCLMPEQPHGYIKCRKYDFF